MPFAIEGTTADPKFVPDVKGMAGSAVQQAISGKVGGGKAANPTSSLGGVFGRKRISRQRWRSLYCASAGFVLLISISLTFHQPHFEAIRTHDKGAVYLQSQLPGHVLLMFLRRG